VRSEFGLGPTDKLVVSLGRLTYQKGMTYYSRQLPCLAHRISTFYWLVAAKMRRNFANWRAR